MDAEKYHEDWFMDSLENIEDDLQSLSEENLENALDKLVSYLEDMDTVNLTTLESAFLSTVLERHPYLFRSHTVPVVTIMHQDAFEHFQRFSHTQDVVVDAKSWTKFDTSFDVISRPYMGLDLGEISTFRFSCCSDESWKR